MLLRCSVENWRSLRGSIDFSMLATRERQHGVRLARLEMHRARILPVAAIFGGNASGKSSFVRALAFARGLVVNGTPADGPIDVEPFRLDPTSAERPSRFSFEVLVGERLYAFSFAVTARAVVEERLVRIGRSSEQVLYERRYGVVTLDASLAKDKSVRFVADRTRENLLVLTNSVSQRVNDFRPVHDWFRDALTIVDAATISEPRTAFEPANVRVIDNGDRGQHTLLTRHRIESYLASCGPTTRTQLVMTLHDLMLIDPRILRRDEVWVAERDEHGASSLTPFSEFKDVRYDKDTRKSYLQGRLGGVPRIAMQLSLERANQERGEPEPGHSDG